MQSVKQTFNNADVIITTIPKNQIEKIDLGICKQPRETLLRYYKRQNRKPDVIINAGFFNMSDGNPVFDTADEGKVIQNNPNIDIGMGIQGANNLVYGKLSQYCWRDFVAAYPPLIANGEPVISTLGKEINYDARRTAIGYNEENIYIVSVDTRGLKFSDLQKIFLNLGAQFAINLDGGGSTELVIGGVKKTTNTYSRPVDTVISFYLKEEHRTLYCVQLGAFSNKSNADRLRLLVRELGESKVGINYSNAYVTFVKPYFKVQVGAFKNAGNAQKVVNDLKSKGFDAFITSKK